jgi:tetratricopeptide (TPR) repeat protein
LGKSIDRSASKYGPRFRRFLAGRYFWPAFIGLIALALRLGHLQESTSSPLFNAPVAAAQTYVEAAAALVADSWVSKPEPFAQPPLYSYCLALVFCIAGQDYFLPRFMQAVLGAAICVLVYFLGRTAFPESVARAAGLGAAVYGPLIYFGAELLPITAATFLFLVFLLFLFKSPRANLWRWLVAGFLLGLAALTATHMLVLLPFLLLWFYADSPGGSAGVRRVLLALLGCGLTIAPVTLRNYLVGHDLVFICTDVGSNFYLGNSADYDRTVGLQPGYEWESLLQSPETEAGIQRSSEKSRYFLTKSFNFIVDEPLQYLTQSLHKCYLFWHGDELSRSLDPYYARNDSLVLRLLMWKYGLAFPFGLIAPLALVGMFCYWRNATGFSSGRLLLLFFLASMFSVMVFFATAQTRLPAVPLALLFACYGMREILLLRGSDRFRPLVATAVLLVATNVGAGAMDMEGDGFEHFALGTAYEEQGMEANALREYKAVLERLPAHRESVTRLGRLYVGRQEYDRAIRVYKTFLEHYPETGSVRFQLAHAQLEAGRGRQALTTYKNLVSQYPQWADLHGRIGYAYLRDGQPMLAISAYRRTLELKPDSSQVRYQLARLYEVEDSLEAAAEQFRVLLEQDPVNAELHVRLADILIHWEGAENNSVYLPQNAATREAEAHLQEAIRLLPKQTQPHWSLGTLLARQTRYTEATKYFERLAELEPHNDQVFIWLANLSRRTGRDEQAKDYISRSATIEREKWRQQQVQEEMDDLLKKMLEGETMSK